MKLLRLQNPLRFVGGFFPILQWSRSYDVETGVGDLIAGITIALTLIPQAIAYASLAGLEPQYGLYASMTGGFIYAFLGTCPQVNIGPTALLSLLTATYTSGTNADFAILLAFIAGIIQLFAGALRLGFLIDLVSLPVVSGFTSAAAITIASSQMKGLLGLTFQGETFIAIWTGVVKHIGETRLADTLNSFACCIVLLGMKALKDIKVKKSKHMSSRQTAFLQRTLWFVGVGRNAFVVALATVVAFLVHEDRSTPLILTGDITPGIPAPQPPAFETTVGNTTYSSKEMLGHLGSGLFVVPLIGIISNVAIAKAFSKGKTLDATQEIVALGICNLIGSFFRSLPVNGSFSRSAVSDASGVKTPAAGFYTGIIVLMTLGLLTPYFYFIPRSALAAVIVCAVLQMVDYEIIKKLWKSNRFDIIPLVGTFLFALGLGIEMGLLCGVAVDVLLLLFYNSRPPMEVKYINDTTLPPHYAVRPIGGLHYAAAERARSQLLTLKNSDSNPALNALENITVISNGIASNAAVPRSNDVMNQCNVESDLNAKKPVNILVIHCDALTRLDYTFLQSLKMLMIEWSRCGHVVFCNADPFIKDQLRTVVQDPLCCETEQLKSTLLGISSTDQTHSTGDTRL